MKWTESVMVAFQSRKSKKKEKKKSQLLTFWQQCGPTIVLCISFLFLVFFKCTMYFWLRVHLQLAGYFCVQIMCVNPQDSKHVSSSAFSIWHLHVNVLFVPCFCFLFVGRYEVRVEACTELGCSSSDWSSILTLEAPPTGQTAPLLDLQPDKDTKLQTSFLLTWSPPAEPNGRILYYEVHRRLDSPTATHNSDAVTAVYRNSSTTWKDNGLHPYTVYQYQVYYLFWVEKKVWKCWQ